MRRYLARGPAHIAVLGRVVLGLNRPLLSKPRRPRSNVHTISRAWQMAVFPPSWTAKFTKISTPLSAAFSATTASGPRVLPLLKRTISKVQHTVQATKLNELDEKVEGSCRIRLRLRAPPLPSLGAVQRPCCCKNPVLLLPQDITIPPWDRKAKAWLYSDLKPHMAAMRIMACGRHEFRCSQWPRCATLPSTQSNTTSKDACYYFRFLAHHPRATTRCEH